MKKIMMKSKTMKKIMMTLAAVLCCAMTTTVFTACGDDDTPTSPVAGAYQYFVEFDILNSYGYYADEAQMVNAALNKAVGLEGNIYKKTYTSNQDAEMKAACEEVLKQFPNLKSLLLGFTLYGNNGVAGQALVVAKLKAGKSLTTPYAKLVLKDEYDTKGMKAIIDSLYSLKTAEDSAKVESLRKKSNNFRTQLYLNIKEAIKDVSDAWYLAKDLDGYNTVFFDQIANAFEEPDSLLYDFTITVSKERLPEADKTKLWEKTFKAYYNK